MTEVKWIDLYMPSHKCVVCGAMWRFWRAKDFPGHGVKQEDSWSLCSNTCGQCCDNVAMGAQIVPIKRKDAMEWLQAWSAVEAMKSALGSECGHCDDKEHCSRPHGICVRAEKHN